MQHPRGSGEGSSQGLRLNKCSGNCHPLSLSPGTPTARSSFSNPGPGSPAGTSKVPEAGATGAGTLVSGAPHPAQGTVHSDFYEISLYSEWEGNPANGRRLGAGTCWEDCREVGGGPRRPPWEVLRERGQHGHGASRGTGQQLSDLRGQGWKERLMTARSFSLEVDRP